MDYKNINKEAEHQLSKCFEKRKTLLEKLNVYCSEEIFVVDQLNNRYKLNDSEIRVLKTQVLESLNKNDSFISKHFQMDGHINPSYIQKEELELSNIINERFMYIDKIEAIRKNGKITNKGKELTLNEEEKEKLVNHIIEKVEKIDKKINYYFSPSHEYERRLEEMRNKKL